ncbi:dTDP-4-dehydrorhamnose reductase [Shewanella sp. 5_MG-2023]|uniref:dTDP-4-dehydrorhamnose reductase n=1 Tax=Shewanella sp. 5_MG-2023 TaxID=3062656 RepID=UPI0026E17526|nr:dTDP-4-dehydrorhamnose reductase [Shewanella sp. 5_MG-2023]MDO6639193.1 dTDP-4-dehydrorhamnose reductase [Shewanella sp. 5_MG-2023]
MKILVTGKYGQVGHCLVKLLEAQSDLEYLALDREQLDITNALQVNKIVNEFKPNIIVNAAAYTAVDKAEQEPELAYAINRDGPLNLALAANYVNAAIIHISTDYVFDGKGVECYTESAVTSPQSEYGRSKLAGEHAVAQTCKKYIILRTAWVFGEHGNNFVKTMLRLAKTRTSLGVVADQFGGPTYAGDIASAILKITKQIISDSHSYGIYHFSGTPYVSWHAFSKKIFEIALEQNVLSQSVQVKPITTLDYPTPAKRPANSRLSCDKINNEYGIKQSDWQDALARIKEYS